MMADLKIGGQAVLNGVTMRSENFVCTSVRKNKKIITRKRKFISITKNNKLFNLPIIRGAISLVEMVGLGMKEIQWATNKSADTKEEELGKKEIIISIIIGFVVAIGIFKLLPWTIASLVPGTQILKNVVDGVIKIIIISAYLYTIGLLPDIKTLYQYHGAEHKAVACHESKKKLIPKNAKKFSRIHPRCGTTFVILVFVVSIFVYTLIPAHFSFWGNYGLRILLLPIIAGLAYELIRISGKYYYKNVLVRALMWPGLQFQRITTNEPNEKQLEVAIKSLENCLKNEKKLISQTRA